MASVLLLGTSCDLVAVPDTLPSLSPNLSSVTSPNAGAEPLSFPRHTALETQRSLFSLFHIGPIPLRRRQDRSDSHCSVTFARPVKVYAIICGPSSCFTLFALCAVGKVDRLRLQPSSMPVMAMQSNPQGSKTVSNPLSATVFARRTALMRKFVQVLQVLECPSFPMFV